MLESFLKFLELGLYHIVSFSSYDHILFVMLLALPYVFKDWKRILILISVFTLGHTLSLLLGVFNIVNLKRQCYRMANTNYYIFCGSI